MRLYQRFCIIVAAAVICAAVYVGRPASAQTQIQAGQVIISELRLRGPAGEEDEFIELYNNTDQAITVQALDTSGGWTVAISDGNITGPLFTIPNGTVIPARGHLLGANTNGYSLGGYPSGNPTPTPSPIFTVKAAPVEKVVLAFATAEPDRTWDFDLADGTGVALFATTSGTNFTTATRLDAVGFANSPALYKEGSGIASVVTSNSEHTYYRDLRGGSSRDTNDNAADFLLVGTVINIQISRLGAPGPENLASPVVNNSTIVATLLDPAVSSSASPNRDRDFTPGDANTATFGTMTIRRTITNNTGQPLSRLRFRIVNTTTVGTPSAECSPDPCADIRALTSTGSTVMTSTGVATVFGLRLEEPPEQLLGGGYNASLSADTITFATPLPDGQSINVEFLLGIQRQGPFRFFLNIEALTGGTIILTDRPAASGAGVSAGATPNRKRVADTVRTAPAAAPASSTPTAAPNYIYAPLYINLTPPASAPASAEEEKDKADEDKEKKSEEEAPPAAGSAPQASTPEAPAADVEPAAQPAPAAAKRAPSKKRPAAAKASAKNQ